MIFSIAKGNEGKPYWGSDPVFILWPWCTLICPRSSLLRTGNSDRSVPYSTLGEAATSYFALLFFFSFLFLLHSSTPSNKSTHFHNDSPSKCACLQHRVKGTEINGCE